MLFVPLNRNVLGTPPCKKGILEQCGRSFHPLNQKDRGLNQTSESASPRLPSRNQSRFSRDLLHRGKNWSIHFIKRHEHVIMINLKNHSVPTPPLPIILPIGNTSDSVTTVFNGTRFLQRSHGQLLFVEHFRRECLDQLISCRKTVTVP